MATPAKIKCINDCIAFQSANWPFKIWLLAIFIFACVILKLAFASIKCQLRKLLILSTEIIFDLLNFFLVTTHKIRYINKGLKIWIDFKQLKFQFLHRY